MMRTRAHRVRRPPRGVWTADLGLRRSGTARLGWTNTSCRPWPARTHGWTSAPVYTPCTVMNTLTPCLHCVRGHSFPPFLPPSIRFPSLIPYPLSLPTVQACPQAPHTAASTGHQRGVSRRKLRSHGISWYSCVLLTTAGCCTATSCARLLMPGGPIEIIITNPTPLPTRT